MESQAFARYTCILIFGIVIFGFYFLVSNRYVDITHTLKIPFVILNFSTNTNKPVTIQYLSNYTFESRLSSTYPYLPIHIYAQNLSLLNKNKSKLIYVGNGFFGGRSWGFFEKNESSAKTMTKLMCPFLTDYCDITIDDDRFSQADAVVYHMRDNVDINGANSKRKAHQRFVFNLWESPAHTPSLHQYKQFFNWTMTYRFESDIITSYYSGNPYVHVSNPFHEMMMKENLMRNLNITFQKMIDQPSEEIFAKKKLGTAAALVTNCGGSSARLPFIHALQKYIDVKVYGRCGEACPTNRNCREFIAENYYFLLSFENSLCTEYTTEKFFATLEHPIIPVVLGRTNYSYFIPPSGYIQTNQFTTMKSLAEYLNQTRNDKQKYSSYFTWKKDYIWGLSQFFTPFCDLCVRLHLDTKAKVYDDIHKWWFEGTCEKPRILP